MFFKKFFTKLKNKEEYQHLKDESKIKKSAEIFKANFKSQISDISKKILEQKNLNFLHSGHAADIVNVLPVIKELSKNHTCNLFININKPINYYFKHPAGKYYINEKIFKMLDPLISSQDYINKFQIFKNEKIDINFDLLRELPINLLLDNTRYATLLTGVHPNLTSEFINAEFHNAIKDYVVIQRTFRYRNQFINYNFIKNYKKILFIGIKNEFDDFKKSVNNCEFHDCKDFMEMAQIIKSSKFTIGNSSLAFPIAEGLKTPRLLESCPYFPAAQPHGKNGYDFYFQEQFEQLFSKLYKKN